MLYGDIVFYFFGILNLIIGWNCRLRVFKIVLLNLVSKERYWIMKII